MGLDLPAGLALKHKIKGNTLELDLLYDPDEWGGKLMDDLPRVRLTEDEGAGFEVMWERIAPGRFQLSRELEEGSVVRGSALVGDYSLPFGPLNVGTSAEWAFDRNRVDELRHIAAVTGGRELLDLQKAWVRPEQVKVTDVRVWLALAVLMCVLLDALMTRVGWPLWAKEANDEKSSAKAVKPPKEIVKPEKEEENSATEESSSESRRARFERSKRRR